MGLDDDPAYDFARHVDALRAAAERIASHRGRLSREDAVHIVRLEFARHAVPVSPTMVAAYAKTLHRGPAWSFRHPVKAHREGIRWSWR